AGRSTTDGWQCSCSEAPTQRQGDATARCLQLIAADAVGQVFVVGLVEQVGQLGVEVGRLQHADLAEAPAEAGVGGDEAGRVVLGAVGEAGGDTVLLGHGAQLGVPVEATLGGLADAEGQLVGWHLVQRFVVLFVLAAQPGEAAVHHEGADGLAGATFKAVDHHFVEVFGAFDRQNAGCVHPGHAAGDVVVDAGMEGRQAIVEVATVALEADLETGGALGLQLGIAGVVVAVATGGILEALAQVGRAVGLADVGVEVEGIGQRVGSAQRPGEVVVAAAQAAGLCRALLLGVASNAVQAGAGDDGGAAELELVLKEQPVGAEFAILERVVALVVVEQRRGVVRVPLRITGTLPAFAADGEQMRTDRHQIGGAQPVCDETDVVAYLVAVETRRVGADFPVDVLAIDLGVQRAFAKAVLQPELVELTALLRRMDGGLADQRRGGGARRTGIPDVAVGMPLHVEADIDVVAQALLVFEQQAVGAVAGALLGAAGAVVIVGLASGGAQHQCVIAAGIAQQHGAVEAFIDTAGGQAEAPALLRLLGKARLG